MNTPSLSGFPMRASHVELFSGLDSHVALARGSFTACGLALTILLGPAAHGQEPELATLFPLQAPIEAAADRFVRLDLPPDVLAACRPDLADLRIFDRQGLEVPYAVDRGDDATHGLEIVRTIEPDLIAVDQRTEEADETAKRWIETYRISVPASLRLLLSATDRESRDTSTADGGTPRDGLATWRLVIRPSAGRFVRQARLTEPHDDSAAAPMLLAEGSFFRLADPDRARLHLDLAAIGPGSAAVWDLTLEGEDGPYLEPAISFVQVEAVAGRERLAVPLNEIGREQRDGLTVIVLERPQGLSPDLLRARTSSASFNRQLEVWDEGPNRTDAPLGRGRISRAPAAETDESLDLPMTPARGDRLRVVVRDRDAPPLADLAFDAVIRTPALLFVLPGDPSAPADDTTGDQESPARTLTRGTLRFGGARAHRPRYDDALLDARTGSDAVHAGRYDPALVLPASLGSVTRSPEFDPTPALAFAHAPGAPVVASHFRHQRRIDAEPSADGLARLVLHAEDLALMRANHADLRIVDPAGQQLPFLLVTGGKEWRELTVSAPSIAQGRSTYRLAPPVVPARIDQLSIAPTVPFFDRTFHLDGQTPTGAIAAQRGRMLRRPGDPRPWRIDLPAPRVVNLELAIDDGDDAPLQFRRVAGRFSIVEIYFPAKAGQYQLLLGDPDARPARFELERIRQVVLALEARDATLGPLEANPAYRALGRVGRQGRWQSVALWAVIAVAIVLLASLTLRLARQEGAS